MNTENLIYSIIPLDESHADEICEDVKKQYEAEVCGLALFMFTLVPDGKPPIDKAEIQGEKYRGFRDKLAEKGLKCGILAQSTLGHGYELDEMPFQPYVGLTDGKSDFSYCPYDENLRRYLKKEFNTLAKLDPETIMVDDDFRSTFKSGRACCCPLHLKAFNEKAGTDLTREELKEIICGHTDLTEKYAEIFDETQREGLVGAAKAIREGIDEVNPKIKGAYCSCGADTGFASDIAPILAGKDNPVIVRINDGWYTNAGNRWFSGNVSLRAATQNCVLKNTDKVDFVLDESDTCPHNRYSTNATSVHAHFTGGILEGLKGAKHWITRLESYEPESGKAYRKKLAENSGFYSSLIRLADGIEWQGARIPLLKAIKHRYNFDGFAINPYNAFTDMVFERLGLPVYFSDKSGGAAFLEGDYIDEFTDEEIRDMLSKTAFMTSEIAEKLTARGFGKYIGTAVREYNGDVPTNEVIDGVKCETQQRAKELLPSEKTEALSYAYRFTAKKSERLFPAVTRFKNELGGTVVVFSGTPNVPFSYLTAFAFLNENRKKQLIKLMKESGNLPVYYSGDAEVFLKTGITKSGERLTAIFDISFDKLEEIPLVFECKPKKIKRLMPSGELKDCEFINENGITTVNEAAETLNPVILISE